jgi:hypothetical protein
MKATKQQAVPEAAYQELTHKQRLMIGKEESQW